MGLASCGSKAQLCSFSVAEFTVYRGEKKSVIHMNSEQIVHCLFVLWKILCELCTDEIRIGMQCIAFCALL